MIRVGTSGWHYRHWKGPFYPETCPPAKMMELYVRHFDTVEINNSFYKLPSPGTFTCWRDQTPEGFCFAVKASRFITHNKKLSDPENALDNFLPRAFLLEEKLGPILFQLPPKWNVNIERLDQFLRVLPRGRHLRYAFEFRNPTWLIPETYNVLRSHNAAFCIFDLAGYLTPLEITADWTYIRLHGPGGKYQGSYTTEQLRDWATQIESWRKRRRAVYVYFDNDQEAYAVKNALQLKTILGVAEAKEAA